MRILRVVAFGAAVALHAGASLAGDASTPEKEQKAGAQKTFDAGSKLYDAHQFEEALAAFRASYQIVPSPNSHLMVARALRELGRDVEAYAEYDAVAKEAAKRGEKYQSAGHAAAEEREEVRAKIALVTVTLAAGAPADAVVKVGDRTLAAAELGTPIPVAPGPVEVTANAGDGSTAKQESTLAAGGASTVTLTLVAPAKPAEAPAPAPAPVVVSTSNTSLRTWAYVAGGVGVVGLATFGIFGAMSDSKYDSLDSSCPDHVCPPGKSGDVDAGKRDQTIANVGLVLGVVGVGAGVTLFLVSQPGKTESAAQASVRVGLRPGSLVVDGRF